MYPRQAPVTKIKACSVCETRVPPKIAGPPRLCYDSGTLVLDNIPQPEPGNPDTELPAGFLWDPRIGKARAPGWRYAATIDHFRNRELVDEARAYQKLDKLKHLSPRKARDYQEEAIKAWKAARWRGVIVLPTGAGKSYVAERCIADTKRSALIIVPTIDLLSQWYGGMRAAFGDPIGIVGGGNHQIENITVSTYDSAALHIERFGHRFGLLIWDEVHHLPAPYYLRTAESAIAPLRVGLTATLERPDGRHSLLDSVVGPVVYRREIPELAGDYLAPYYTEVLTVRLSDEEQQEYVECRALYKDFLEQNRLSVRTPEGWQKFIMVSSRTADGRAAFAAWRRSRQLVATTERKLELVRQLVADEWGRPTIIFTNDNPTALRISQMLLCPCITHRTETKERRLYLDGFAKGEFTVLVTSRVLNEGVDLPGAEVAIIVSGTSTVRESVQRLGRILRQKEGKEAVLYELVAENTNESFISERRRDHDAYR